MSEIYTHLDSVPKGLNRLQVARQAFARMFWEEPELWDIVQLSETTNQLIAEGLRQRESMKLAQGDRAVVEPYRHPADGLEMRRFVELHYLWVPDEVLMLAEWLEGDFLAGTIVLAMAGFIGSADQLIRETLANWDFPTSLDQPALDVYLVRCVERVLERPMPQPFRTVADEVTVEMDQTDVRLFTFDPPLEATTIELRNLIEEWTRNVRQALLDEFVLPFHPQQVNELRRSIERNARWLYEQRVRNRAVRYIARRDLGDPERGKDIRDGNKAILRDLNVLTGGN